MDFETFQNSLSAANPPSGSSVYLQSLWYDGKGDWEKSHTIIQDVPDKTASWIHAYLHRKEGDDGNAGYWYSKAGKRMPAYSLEKEWEEIVRELL
jgi:hypothetical protein